MNSAANAPITKENADAPRPDLAEPAPEVVAPIPPTAPKNADGTYMAPSEIVAAAPAADWGAIAASDLLVMDLAADAKGKPRRVIIQLMPLPFSQGWIGNIRKLAAAKWWDGTSVNRVQDNYVTQWGDATEKKPLPEGLVTVGESDYIQPIEIRMMADELVTGYYAFPSIMPFSVTQLGQISSPSVRTPVIKPYASVEGFSDGWPVGVSGEITFGAISDKKETAWPVHCYGMVGVGRGMSHDTGTGAELYTVIGHAPRHLDRNIGLVGRVISGIEHLSSLPRGTGPLGFYESAEERVPILSVRVGTDVAELPSFEYLSTESATFAKYADARANRRDPFFNVPAGGADICNIPVPVRAKVSTKT